jgi:hypothetical protein
MKTVYLPLACAEAKNFGRSVCRSDEFTPVRTCDALKHHPFHSAYLVEGKYAAHDFPTDILRREYASCLQDQDQALVRRRFTLRRTNIGAALTNSTL